MKNLLLTQKQKYKFFSQKYRTVIMEHQPQQKINLPQDFDQEYRIPFQKVKEWKKYLIENGFVVVKNFLPRERCEYYMNDIWAMMEKLSLGKLKKDDIQTQKNVQNYPSSHHGGLMQYIGHAKFQWQLRKLTRPIFEELWEDKQLKCSFDGVNFSNGVQKFPFTPENQGLHVDQPPIKKGLWSYQGIMALTDAGNHGGGFVCVPKSHLYFAKYFKDVDMKGFPKARWIKEQDKYKQPLCNYVKVNSEAGDFILFDSRTFHCGCQPSNHNLRVVTYICMMPTKLVPQKVQAERLKAFYSRMNSGHHCGDGFRTFPKIPKTAPRDKQQLQEFEKAIFELNQSLSKDLEDDKQVMALDRNK